ncbi:MAG: hypothetical protein J7483_07320 [Novosphingobium sp.]|nr:hypothetical protein [Novosphingobium sp.]
MRLDEAATLETGEILVRGGRAIAHRRPMPLAGGDRARFVEVDHVDDEVVGVDDLDPVGVDRLGGKMLEIGSDDAVAPPDDRGGEDMAVVGVGQLEDVDERPVAVASASGK